MSDTFSRQLLQEMENAVASSEDDEIGIVEVKYEIIPGLRANSRLMWAFEENQLYYENSYSKSKQQRPFTCRVKGCPARVFVRDDQTAYRDLETTHLSSHGSQYQDYKLMYCTNEMKRRAVTAPASMTSYDIYMETILEYVLFQHYFKWNI